jgi:serine/threonine-protein kinase
MIGQTIATYRILRELSNDRGGKVFLALDTELERNVVLKFIAKDIDLDLATRDRLVTEAKSAARLHNPNIVTVYKVGAHEGRPFIAIEYVEGRTLADMIANETIEPREAAGIAIQLCEALSEARKGGVLHFDISPDKILIGHGGRARIAISFGVPARQTGAGRDERSDVRVIGSLLQDMGGSDQFADIISRAISDRPDERHATLEALAEDIEDTRHRLFGDTHPKTTIKLPIIPIAAVVVIATIVAIVMMTKPFDRDTSSLEAPRRETIVVLPFENLGDAADEYFADGVTDEITSRLSFMQGLGVISRRSSRVFKNTPKSIKEIGEELSVDYVMEGTIRWDKSAGVGRVRITPQLIRVSDDTHVWSNTYEREITEIFTVQADIATQIASALDVTLRDDEWEAVTQHPTRNIDAYQAYLRGDELLHAPDFGRESLELGIQMMERAIDLDPEFALAHARLSTLHSRLVHYGFDRSEERLAMARSAVDHAFALEPELAEAYLALGYYYYWGYRDYNSALDALDVARERAPSSSEIAQATAYVKRRQGDLEGCARLLERDLTLSPMDALARVSLGETYGTLRRYAVAERALVEGITLAPDNAYPYTELALLYLRWRGDVAAAREALERTPAVTSSEACRVGFFIELLDRNYAAALDRLNACPEPVLEAAVFYLPVPLLKGLTYQAMNEPEDASKVFEAARAVLVDKLAENPDDYRVHSALGITYAGLGWREDAVRHGERAVELYPVSRDALAAPVLIIDLALTYAMVGEYDAALERLDYVLSIPSILSAPWLAKDPRWDSLRSHDGFESLLRKYPIDPNI